jgi:hypothetical protein
MLSFTSLAHYRAWLQYELKRITIRDEKTQNEKREKRGNELFIIVTDIVSLSAPLAPWL